MTRKPQVMSDQ